MGERGSLGILETIVTDVLEPWIQPSAIRMMTDTGASLSRAPLTKVPVALPNEYPCDFNVVRGLSYPVVQDGSDLASFNR